MASWACNSLVVNYLINPAMTAAIGEGNEDAIAGMAKLCRMGVTAATYANPVTGTLGSISKAAMFTEFAIDGITGAYDTYSLHQAYKGEKNENLMLENAMNRQEVITKLDTSIWETLMKSADEGTVLEALMSDNDRHDMLRKAGVSPVSETVKSLSGVLVNLPKVTGKEIDIDNIVATLQTGIEESNDIAEERINELEPAEIGDVDDRLAVELQEKGLLKGHSYNDIKKRIAENMKGKSELAKVYAELETDLVDTDHLTTADARARLTGLSNIGQALMKDLHTATKEAEEQSKTDVVTIKGYVRVPLEGGGYEVWKAEDLKHAYAVKHVEDKGMEIMGDLTERVYGSRDQMVAFLRGVHDMSLKEAEEIVNFTQAENMAHKLTDMASGVKRDARQAMDRIEEVV